MGLEAGTPMRDVKVDTVFVGSCTNGRIEDLRLAAAILEGRQVADDTRLLVVPGSVRVRLQAEDEGLDKVFMEAGARVARRRLLDVPGHEPRPARPRGAQRVDVQPQLRGPPGQGRTHAPRLGARRRRHRRPRHALLARRPRTVAGGLTHGASSPPTPASASRCERSNVDTDQIIPAVYLKRVTRTGFEDGLFAAWRNDPTSCSTTRPYAGGSVLVAGPDFGTGSSREHAVWALQNYGFKAVISSRFADIFRGNSGKAGLVAAQVDEKVVQRLWDCLEDNPGGEVTVDLESPHRPRRRRRPDAVEDSFDIDDYTRWRLLEGLDDIGITLSHEATSRRSRRRDRAGSPPREATVPGSPSTASEKPLQTRGLW